MPRPDTEWDPDAAPLSPTFARNSANNLIEALEAQFVRFLVTEPGIPLLLAIWSLATHAYQQFRTFPYLGIMSPMPECGKTTVLDVLGLFAARPDSRLSMTPASLYRCVERDKPTLLIDEQQLIGTTTHQALKELLDKGYKRGAKLSVVVPRVVSSMFIVRRLSRSSAIYPRLSPVAVSRCTWTHSGRMT